ncbi:Thymus-specific serine protease [Dinochytrium kinnereticum]|nr:Thymus-specific serine protease [Dinochytrium kinnereticum]
MITSFKVLAAVIAVMGVAQSAVANFMVDKIMREEYLAKLREESEHARLESMGAAGGSKFQALGIPEVQTHYFNQTIDHFSNSTETFPQKYFVYDYYYEKGGPIIFYVEGEASASPWTLYNYWEMAQTYKAMVVSLEHRFYSPDSFPVIDYSLSSLKLLSSRQAIKDGVNFLQWFRASQNVPECTKVVAIGGSYPGNMAAYYRIKHPELVWAAYASSAPVNVVEDFRQYSKAVRLGMANPALLGNPQCSENWRRAVFQLDLGLERRFEQTRADFGLKFINNIGEIGYSITTPMAWAVQYGPYYSSYNASVDLMSSVCSGVWFPEFMNPNATDAALYDTLRRWYLGWMNTRGYIPNDQNSTAPFSAENRLSLTPYLQLFAKPNANNNYWAGSSYFWFFQVCNEYGYFQTAEFINKPAYSRYVTKEYYYYFCSLYFGEQGSRPDVPGTVAYWGTMESMRPERMIWVNGEADPWQWLSVKNRRTRGTEFVFRHNMFHCDDLRPVYEWDEPSLKAAKLDVKNAWKTIMALDTCPAMVAAGAA